MKFNGQSKIISSVSFLLVFVCCLKSIGQNLPMPPDIQKAYQKGTHLTNGKPGKNYWQNTGNYNISITANPPERNIRGTEDITYFNNSLDTLKQLVIRLVQNIHKRGTRRNPNSQADTLSNGIVIDQFKVNGKTKPLPDNEGHYTWQNVDLDMPLLPHNSIKLSVNWHFYISPQKGREGIFWTKRPTSSPIIIRGFRFTMITTVGTDWILPAGASFTTILTTTAYKLPFQKTLWFGRPELCKIQTKF